MLVLVLLCAEVESLIVTLRHGAIQGYEMVEPYAEAMVPVTATGLLCLCMQRHAIALLGVFQFTWVSQLVVGWPSKTSNITLYRVASY